MSDHLQSQYHLDDLLYLMARLRDPQTGCPWDVKQDYKSIAPSTLEEAYEVVDAIEREDFEHLQEELGDLLFQVIFYSQLAEEQNRFNFGSVVQGLTAKLVRRHPHVFPNGELRAKVRAELCENTIKQNWEALKQQEREAKGNAGVLDDVPLSLPALSRAQKLQKRAAQVGFNWSDVGGVLDKLAEETRELSEALEDGDREAQKEELGDMLFTLVNLARYLNFDSEAVLRQANAKFCRRFRYIEQQLAAQGRVLQPSELDRMEALWQEAKLLDKSAGP